MSEKSCITCKHCGVKFDRESKRFVRFCGIEDTFDHKLNPTEPGMWHCFRCNWHNDKIGKLRRDIRELLAR
jgi:hypothetical protein